jgi:hypothetical protein
MSKHTNNGKCAKCNEILNTYPNMHPSLQMWFKLAQNLYNKAHISEAGRGKKRQEEFLAKKATKAKYGESAHNYNMAIDIFFVLENGKASWDKALYEEFNKINKPEKYNIKAYSQDPKLSWDLPHYEVEYWKKDPNKKLVE